MAKHASDKSLWRHFCGGKSSLIAYVYDDMRGSQFAQVLVVIEILCLEGCDNRVRSSSEIRVCAVPRRLQKPSSFTFTGLSCIIGSSWVPCTYSITMELP